MVEALHHAAGQITKHGRFLVIPVAGERIHSIILPERAQDLIGHGKMLLVVYQDGHRAAGDIPAAHAEHQALAAGLFLPGTIQMRIFQEVRVAGAVHPHIGTYKYMAASQLGL